MDGLGKIQSINGWRVGHLVKTMESTIRFSVVKYVVLVTYNLVDLSSIYKPVPPAKYS